MRAVAASAGADTMEPSAWARLSQSVGWPVVTGLAAFFFGLALLGTAALFFQQARQLHASSAALMSTAKPTVSVASAPAPDAFVSQLPDDATYLDDVAFIFKQAKEQNVTIGAITYRTEAGAAMPVVTHTLDMRLDEDYPKLKAFVAQLLSEMPHLYLDEIQVEQASSPAATGLGTKVQAMLKLSLVYRKAVSPGLPRPATDKKAQASR